MPRGDPIPHDDGRSPDHHGTNRLEQKRSAHFEERPADSSGQQQTAQSSEEGTQDVGYARGLLDFYSREIRGTRILPDGGKLTPVNRAVHKP